MSSITGPSLGFKLPRTILPTEVIMVSRYTSPMVSSFTTWLELTLERPGLNTKQAVTPVEATEQCGWPY